MKCTLFKGLKKMEGPFPGLRELHKKLLQAASLQEDASACAALLMPCTPNEACNNSQAIHENVGTETNLATAWVARDVTLLQLSLIQILIIKAENLCTEPQVRRQYSHVLELLQQSGVDTTIIGLFHTSDKVLSHISSKCLSHLVLYQLKYKNEVNDHWLQFCLNTFGEDPGSSTLMPCLMSLTAVYKGLLVDERMRKADYLLQIMVALENVFEGFCSTCISRMSVTECQPDAESSSQLSCLLDLLEVMVALRMELKLNVSLCKRVLSVILPQALNLMPCPVPYFVKKQVILVLKRCLLYKAGEDFLPSPHKIYNQQDVALDEDLAVLATTLLNAVQQGWLLQVPSSDRSSSFGGANEGAEHGPDLVILGAASLSLLKAMEIQFHSKAYGSIGQGYSEFSEMPMYMAHLLSFLKQHFGWQEPVHFCEWVSLTFIEQDDDMLEVAKSLLQMYLHSPRQRTPTNDEEDIVKLPSHQCGMNPHCMFLFLLKNVLFDASVLLDFLISSETCFLEYFVRYLKLLKEDWPQFCSTCTFLNKSASLHLPSVASDSVRPLPTVSLPRAQECICSPHVDTSAVAGPKIGEQPPCSHRSEGSSSLGALQRLVEYDSSEDSESEMSGSEPRSVIAHRAGADSSDIDKHMKKLGLTAMCSGFHTSASKQAATYQAVGIQQKSAQCLVELQEAIHRLHRKKLFPYNPSALLKLLTHVRALSKE